MSNMPGRWRKSSFSGNEYECVEVSLGPRQVRARDSKDPMGPQLVFSAHAWRDFIAGVMDGTLEGPWS